ncbi:MAG: hypothetical protein ACE1ZZ_04125 [Dehalococcoidia bacterium]
MSQELGRLDRPAAHQFAGKRKLFLLPLIHAPGVEEPAAKELLDKFWDQTRQQIASLESGLGRLRHIFHETLTEGGESGLKQLEMSNSRSHRFVQEKCQAGASLIAIEEAELMMETLDLRRFLMMPLASQRVDQRIQEWFAESNRERYKHIAERIDASLGEDQVGLLLISEGHQVQFPSDLEVFYVAPPALDEFRRWFQNWLAEQREKMASSPTEDEYQEEQPEE